MEHVIDLLATAYTWLWATAGWWLVAFIAAFTVVAGVVEWRRR